MRWFDALVFDLNGTLVDIFKISEYNANVDEFIDILGVEPARFTAAWKESWKAFPFGDYPSVRARFEVALEHYHGGKDHDLPPRLDDAVEARVAYIKRVQYGVREGVFDALDWAVVSGYKLGMVTNCATETVQLWPGNPLARYFPDPTFSCELKIKKPDAEIFLNELEKLRVDPGRAIYVADGDDHELDTASALGMEVILLSYDTADAFRHQPFPDARHVISSFHELRPAIERIERDAAGKHRGRG